MERIDKTVILELLSPAKDLDSGKTAIMSGADAVYIGGPDFSARSAAGNSWEDIEALCSFAHVYYAKVYIAVNTIFYDGEEGNVQEILRRAYDAGADGMIIQDMGILKLDVPPLPLIASTQCDNRTPEHIRFLRDAGFSRIILARELSIDQIRNIRNEVPGIELEAFVHGALCVSYSGRCAFSHYLTGRSSNRGECIQVCRLPFDLEDSQGNIIEKNSYLLSPKDLDLSEYLEELTDAGVTSFKIEGRLKDASYAGNVTAFYRQRLDRIISESCGKYKKASSGTVKLNYEPDLNKTFNRGFTKYFISGREETVIPESGQKSAGEFMGTVKEVGKDHFILDRKHDLKNGDGICWAGEDGELKGVNINTVDGGRIFPNRKLPHSAGIRIFRNENPAFEKAILSGAARSIGVSVIVRETDGQFTVKAADEDGNTAELYFDHDKIPANNPDIVREIWRKQFSRTGDTVFFITDLDYEAGDPFFVPVSKLNQWRRKTLAALLEERIRNHPRDPVIHSRIVPEYPRNRIDPSYNVSNRLAEDFYTEAGAEKIERAAETSDMPGKRILMTAKHCLKYHFGACVKYGGPGKLNEPLFLVLNGKRFRLEFECSACEMRVLAE